MKVSIKVSGIIAMVAALAIVVVAVPTFARGNGQSQSGPIISEDEAKAAALAANPGTVVSKIDLDSEDGLQVYDIELDNGQEIQVDAADGAILVAESEKSDDSADDAQDTDDVQNEVEEQDNATEEAGEADIASESDEVDEVPPANTGITADDARDIAGEAYPDTVVLGIEFDREGGIDLFEAELDNGTDVKIDANSGEILGTDSRNGD